MWGGVTPQGLKVPLRTNMRSVRGVDPTKSPQGLKCEAPAVQGAQHTGLNMFYPTWSVEILKEIEELEKLKEKYANEYTQYVKINTTNIYNALQDYNIKQLCEELHINPNYVNVYITQYKNLLKNLGIIQLDKWVMVELFKKFVRMKIYVKYTKQKYV